MTVRDAAAKLEVSSDTVYQLCARGLLPRTTRLGPIAPEPTRAEKAAIRARYLAIRATKRDAPPAPVTFPRAAMRRWNTAAREEALAS